MAQSSTPADKPVSKDNTAPAETAPAGAAALGVQDGIDRVAMLSLRADGTSGQRGDAEVFGGHDPRPEHMANAAPGFAANAEQAVTVGRAAHEAAQSA